MNSFPKLSYACPIPWDSLRGDERAKFCQQCGRTVTNLSELNEKARLALLAEAGSERMCVTYYRRLSGEFVTPESPLTPAERSGIKQLGVAALSAGALALAAGCMATDQPAKTNASPAQLAPPPAQSPTGKPVALSEPQKLAWYDKNRNGKLDPDEVAAMQADEAKGVKPDSGNDVMVLQAFGVVADFTPAQQKKWIDREIEFERDQKAVDAGAGPYSEESWQSYWTEIIRGYQDPHRVGGPRPNDTELVRHILSQRRKFHLPELKTANAP